ncbi:MULTISPECIES: AraC family transcriptional regulator [Bradyrhizobium]|jgi:AraC-like DNA-binding protein|uniref:AraC-like DNA-binding protein n=1 Tax=Bradyrhizobium elkanii TaxID=29448 RepID=A0A8I2C0T5_BRAEL|nr:MULTISPECIES: AraC family transcriptional regulator [Bradyrhizobium]MBP1294110.1 AraC-like DNA-binding protein [Bradyrhizobium elkanii]MCP1925306.1 AraC-like DNA-binding protein [Bradyrhizobium elkanii]MCP1966752.1 AraC-like DNA-binding protein [Bradyrhizobium elkanii]MCS3477201.1 AraC-like DNA-binding protein [Bradyrhizobium elkanii]MCS3522917.1 AraC-like DNA-binding protein [Bradyrhizobium elkanii]
MPTDAANFASYRFSTRDLPERIRIPLWREHFGRCIVRADIEPLSESSFLADASLRAVQGLRMLALKGTSMRFKRLQANLADGDDSIGVIFCSPGKSQLSQRGQEADLCAGNAIAILHSEPASVTYIDGSQFGLAVPREALAQRVADVEGLVMRPILQRTEAFRLFTSYMKSVLRTKALSTPKLRETVVTHIHDLVALAIDDCPALGESSASAVVAARHRAVLDYIATHFQEPGLSVQAVARRQGISSRYLQRLMASSGPSFTERMNELRLQQALKLLTEPDAGRQRISDIALEVGFSDVSYFNRLFRTRFGDSPRGVRLARKGSH